MKSVKGRAVKVGDNAVEMKLIDDAILWDT